MSYVIWNKEVTGLTRSILKLNRVQRFRLINKTDNDWDYDNKNTTKLMGCSSL